MLIKAACIIIAFPSTTILLTNSCSSLRVLGTLNGFATAFSGLGRAGGPLVTGVVFTWGVDHGFILAPFLVLAIVGAIGIIPVMLIEEGDGPSATPEQSDGEEDEEDGETMVGSSMLLPNESAVEDSESDDEGPSAQAPLLKKKANGASQYGTNGTSK